MILGVSMKMDAEIRSILHVLREKVETGVEAIYGDRSKALSDIEALLKSPSTDALTALIAPTANLQELSIENGWGNEFNELAAKLETL